jgi:hypothetical protein
VIIIGCKTFNFVARILHFLDDENIEALESSFVNFLISTGETIGKMVEVFGNAIASVLVTVSGLSKAFVP